MSKKPVPKPTPDSQPFWDACKRGVLSIQRCVSCGPFFYPRSHCPRCGSDAVEWFEASGRATLYSYIINHVPPGPGFEDEGPYAIAVVQLEEGPRMMANILGVEQTPEVLTLDMPLEVTFESRGDMTIPQFAPTRGR